MFYFLQDTDQRSEKNSDDISLFQNEQPPLQVSSKYFFRFEELNCT